MLRFVHTSRGHFGGQSSVEVQAYQPSDLTPTTELELPSVLPLRMISNAVATRLPEAKR
jgi:hypothetical protein